MCLSWYDWPTLELALVSDRPSEKRKVGSSTLPLTTTPELAVSALLPAETQEESEPA